MGVGKGVGIWIGIFKKHKKITHRHIPKHHQIHLHALWLIIKVSYPRVIPSPFHNVIFRMVLAWNPFTCKRELGGGKKELTQENKMHSKVKNIQWEMLNELSFCICICLYLCVHMRDKTHVLRSEDDLMELVLSFHLVRSGDWINVIGLSMKCLYLLTHLAPLNNILLDMHISTFTQDGFRNKDWDLCGMKEWERESCD